MHGVASMVSHCSAIHAKKILQLSTSDFKYGFSQSRAVLTGKVAKKRCASKARTSLFRLIRPIRFFILASALKPQNPPASGSPISVLLPCIIGKPSYFNEEASL
jgi:hypothetical protein